MKPLTWTCDQTDTLLQRNWYQMYLGFLSFGAYQQGQEGILMHGQPRLSISSAQACTLERILQRHLMVSTQHGQQQFTGFKPYC